MVHGEQEAQKAMDAARALFDKNAHSEDMPTTVLSKEDMGEGEIGIIDLLMKAGLVPSRGEARRLITQGGIAVDDQKVTGIEKTFSASDFEKGHIIIKKGKKVFHKVTLQ